MIRRLSHLNHIIRSNAVERELLEGVVYGTRKRRLPRKLSLVHGRRAAHDRTERRAMTRETAAQI